MIKGIKILCQAYEFPEATPKNKRLFYNPESNKTAVGPEIDLADYLVSLDKLTFSRDVASNNLDNLLYEFGDLKLSVAGIKDSRFLENYFLIFDESNLWSRRKYLIKFYHNNVIKFKGFIDVQSMTEPFRRPNGSNNTNIIDINIIHVSKEFKDYINTVFLPEPASIFAGAFHLPWRGDARAEDKDLCNSQYVHTVIEALTGLTTAMGGGNMYNWQICNIPQMFNASWSGNWFVRSGYKRWWQEQITVYQFLSFLCKSFGWVWSLDNDHDWIIIKNRSEFSYTTTQIDFRDVVEYDITFAAEGNAQHIIIPDGQLRSFNYRTGLGTEMGPRFKMISNTRAVNNFTNFFQSIAGEAGASYELHVADYFRSSAKEKEDSLNFQYGERWITGQNWNNHDVERFTIPLSETLIVDAGNQTAMRTVVDPATSFNYPALDYGEALWDIVYSGNVGACCVIRGVYMDLEQDYHSYCQAAQFRNNYLPLLSGNEGKTIPITIKGIYDNPFITIQFINALKPYFSNGSFAVNSLEVDYINKSSKFIITRK